MKNIRREDIQELLRFKVVKRRILSLFRIPFFWAITLWGNACTLIGAVAFHHLEGGKNPGLQDFLDALTWAVGMVTSVGSSINPITPAGKILSVVMMLGGSLFLWSYMALIVGAFVNPEIRYIGHEVEEGEKLLLKIRGLLEKSNVT